jgi:hypothetical protein
MSTYGQPLNTKQLTLFLDHVFRNHDDKDPKRNTPVLIWGSHGLGKTESIMDYARKRNWKIAYCAPAQFEEMGDLHGMPIIHDPDPKVHGDEITVYSPPSWIPKDPGPGLLILDDINRADDRILRGVMQLLQNFELMSWSLPPNWHIVATANPDDGNYSVTTMDEAMLTRMLHVTLEFDVKSWLAWAVENNIDSRGINFVATYPESITGNRTTPRSLVQFFEHLKGIQNLKENIELVNILASSTLDRTTVSSFIAYINDDLDVLLSPEEILGSRNWNETSKQIQEIATDKSGAFRLDRLSTIVMRLTQFLMDNNYMAEPQHKENLISFMLLECIPSDLKMSLFLDLSNKGHMQIKEMIKDPKIAKLMINFM